MQLLHKIISKTSKVQEDTCAPDISLTTTEGAEIQLSALWKTQNLIVVFMRHVGCTFCRHHVMQLRKDYRKFRELGAEVVCIVQGKPKLGKAFKVMFDLPFPILMSGNDTSVYQIYGLGRGTLSELIGVNSWIQGFLALFTLGFKVIGPLAGDGTQMPGTFIIDQSGTIQLAYRSKDAADNPPNRLLIEKLQKMQGGPHIDVKHVSKPTVPVSASKAEVRSAIGDNGHIGYSCCRRVELASGSS